MKLILYGSPSRCCKSPSRIVLSREGGFVTQNCISCGVPRALNLNDIQELYCSACSSKLIKYINSDKNYAFKCHKCNHSIELASLVPHWSEIFDYKGYALEGDEVVSDRRITPTIGYNSLKEILDDIRKNR